MRPSINQQFSIAEGLIIKNLKLLNLKDFDNDNIFINDKISETNVDEEETFYYITQELAHYIQNKGFDGILYKSAIKNDGSNIVLFDKNNVLFTSSSVVNVTKVEIEYEQVFPFEENN